jgi:tetratricopeptide (TPR) repeat protein
VLAVITAIFDIIIVFPLYKLSALAVVLIAAVGGTAIMLARLQHVVQKHLLSKDANIMEMITTVLVLLGIACAGIALVGRDILNAVAPLMDETKNLNHDQVISIVRECSGIGLIAVSILLAISAVFWLLRKDYIRISVSEESQQWLTSTTVTFVVLSIGLIALANLKMDIQDTFIQRVKFISSHMFFAFWVGYGMIFLLSYLDGALLKKNPTLKWLTIAVAAALPITPLLVNEFNDKLLFVYGGAEQNGHDFGWQFGNYQLRGAEAILEELSPDEEPLPNPTYPKAMEQGAIFFGGTDPGRFVPTYMIYSADVRPDVFLITQNALADNTYMNVMRDLYGNEIWIPSMADSAKAFQSYIDDVRTGKRPTNAGVHVENGRVQISGVLGVMEVNGILAKNIFDYNNYKHAFYVEESYVIRWMYPYLEPHGLIMKINHDRLARLTPTMVNNDTDFWDWYTRRLTTNRKFMRDIVARKSFSKLRSAIAGLYASRGLRLEAETAFQESRKLYKLSPEANFRLAEVYMRSHQIDKAIAIIHEFQKMDPANSKSEQFLANIERTKGTYAQISELEKLSKDGRLSPANALKLASLYRQVGQKGRFNSLLSSILNTKKLPLQIRFQVAVAYAQSKQFNEMSRVLDYCLKSMPSNVNPQVYLQVASMYAQGGNPTGMVKALNIYLKHNPQDWKAWLDLANVEIRTNHPDQANSALNSALRYGGNEARNEIMKNQLLNQLLKSRSVRTRNLINMGLK